MAAEKDVKPRMKLLIVDDDRDYAHVLRDYFSLFPEYEVLGCSYNGKDALRNIELLQPDAIILDLMMPYYDGLFVMDGMEKLHLHKLPYAIIHSALPYNPTISRKLQENQNSYFMMKPLDLESMNARLMEHHRYGGTPSAKSGFAESKLSTLLDRMNFAPCTKGKSFVLSALRFLDKDNSMLQALTKELYPLVGQKHLGASAGNVERMIRAAIASAWEKDDGAAMQEIFAEYEINLQARPSNGQFLAYMLEILHR